MRQLGIKSIENVKNALKNEAIFWKFIFSLVSLDFLKLKVLIKNLYNLFIKTSIFGKT